MLYKPEFLREIQKRAGLKSLAVAEQVYNAVWGIVSDELMTEDGEILILNFGKFTTRKIESYQARNPKTGETVTVPPKLQVRFRPAERYRKALKEVVR